MGDPNAYVSGCVRIWGDTERTTMADAPTVWASSSDFFCPPSSASLCLGFHFAYGAGRGRLSFCCPAPTETGRWAPACFHRCFPSWPMTACIGLSGPQVEMMARPQPRHVEPGIWCFSSLAELDNLSSEETSASWKNAVTRQEQGKNTGSWVVVSVLPWAQGQPAGAGQPHREVVTLCGGPPMSPPKLVVYKGRKRSTHALFTQSLDSFCYTGCLLTIHCIV